MPTPLPILPNIAEPCTQSWEAMPGNARVRHCASCNQDVVNTAALSTAEIAELLRGPLPCLRIARYDDGTLVTTEPAAHRPLPRIAAGLLTAALALGSAAAQDARPQQVLLGAPPPAPPQAQVSGRVTGHAGHPLAGSTATLLRDGRVVATVQLGPAGTYSLAAPAGRYDLRIEAPNSTPQTIPIQLSAAKPLTQPVELQPRTVTMGRILPPPRPTITAGKPAVPRSK